MFTLFYIHFTGLFPFRSRADECVTRDLLRPIHVVYNGVIIMATRTGSGAVLIGLHFNVGPKWCLVISPFAETQSIQRPINCDSEQADREREILGAWTCPKHIRRRRRRRSTTQQTNNSSGSDLCTFLQATGRRW